MLLLTILLVPMNCGHGFPPFLGPSLTKGGAKKGKKAGQNLKIHHSGEVMSSKTKKSPPELRWVSGTVARLLSHSSPRKLENKHPKSKNPKIRIHQQQSESEINNQNRRFKTEFRKTKSRGPKSKNQQPQIPRFKHKPRNTKPKGHSRISCWETKPKFLDLNRQNRHLDHKPTLGDCHQGSGEPGRRHGHHRRWFYPAHGAKGRRVKEREIRNWEREVFTFQKLSSFIRKLTKTKP